MFGSCKEDTAAVQCMTCSIPKTIVLKLCRVSLALGTLRLMFPIALVAQYFGVSNSRMSLNVLARSFPWIGIHVDVLRTGQRRLWPLFRSHMLFLLIQSFAAGVKNYFDRRFVWI